jgi:anti-anti-sigma regulatory factor
MDTCFEKSGDHGVLSVEGELTIEYAAGLKTALAEALNSGLHLILDVAKVAKTDVSCLQLICSAHKSAVLSGKTITLRNTGGEFVRALKDTGFLRHVGCAPGTGDACVWLRERIMDVESPSA